MIKIKNRILFSLKIINQQGNLFFPKIKTRHNKALPSLTINLVNSNLRLKIISFKIKRSKMIKKISKIISRDHPQNLIISFRPTITLINNNKHKILRIQLPNLLVKIKFNRLLLNNKEISLIIKNKRPPNCFKLIQFNKEIK